MHGVGLCIFLQVRKMPLVCVQLKHVESSGGHCLRLTVIVWLQHFKSLVDCKGNDDHFFFIPGKEMPEESVLRYVCITGEDKVGNVLYGAAVSAWCCIIMSQVTNHFFKLRTGFFQFRRVQVVAIA